jgi:hypothetical protein
MDRRVSKTADDDPGLIFQIDQGEKPMTKEKQILHIP